MVEKNYHNIMVQNKVLELVYKKWKFFSPTYCYKKIKKYFSRILNIKRTTANKHHKNKKEL